MNIFIKGFDKLTPSELYDILHLRAEVFIMEQNCPYQDLDYYDQKADHLCLSRDEKLIGYSRIFPPGVKYEDASIGRIVTHPDVRNKGVGIEVVNKSIEYCRKRFPGSSIRISAQCYLDRFYRSFGFVKVSEVYLEDNIDHQEMLLEF